MAGKSALRSSASVSLAVLASRVLGVVRESLLAALFGVSALTDAYNVAFRIPNLLRDLFAEGALSSAFVPTFADALANGGRERAYRLGNLMITGLVLVTGAITLAGLLEAEWVVRLISRGFPEQADAAFKVALATRLAQVMMPILLLVSVSAAWMGMLNAQQRFLAPAYAPALFNVVSISTGLALYAARMPPSPRTILIWSVGTTAGGMVQALVQLPSLWRLGYRPRVELRGLTSDPGVRRVLRLMAPAVVGLAAIQINVFVNTQFAAMLGTGPLTLLNNSFRLFYLPVGLFGVALATVTTARASEDAARGDRAALVGRVAEGARAVWMLALPSAVGLVVLAEPVIALLYQRGKFSHANTLAMIPIVQAYMVGVLPYSLVKVYSPAFYAVDRPRVPMIASLSAVAANIAFNAATYRTLGAKGLALGTTLSALVNLGILRVAFARVVGRQRGGLVLARAVAAAAVMGAVVWGAWRVAGPVVAEQRAHVTATRAALLFATIALGFVVYAAVLRALRFPGADELWHLPRKIARRLRGRR